MSSYLVDLPALPLAMNICFALMGHTVLAAMTPALLAGMLFTVLVYLAFRELTQNTVLGYVAAVALATFPLLAFYVLRAAEPDGLFLSLLAALAFLAIRCDNDRRSRWAWPALGLVAGLICLTRPEGIMYSAMTFLTLAIRFRSNRGFWLATALCGSMVAAFSATMLLTFGTPWPSSFAGTIQLRHVGQNIGGFAASALPAYAGALGISAPALVSVAMAVMVLYAIGAVLLAQRRPQLLFLALLPAMNIALFLLVSPALTRPELPYDYFRRAAYGLPFLALVASYPIALALLRLPRGRAKLLALSVLLAVSVAVASYQNRLGARPELIWEGGTQILTGGVYILATDLIDHPYDLPRLPYGRVGGIVQVDRSFDYMAFRSELNGFFAPMDLHGSDRASGYASASLIVFLVGLGYSLLARPGDAFGEKTAGPE